MIMWMIFFSALSVLVGVFLILHTYYINVYKPAIDTLTGTVKESVEIMKREFTVVEGQNEAILHSVSVLSRNILSDTWVNETTCPNCNYKKQASWQFDYCPKCGKKLIKR